MTKFKNITFIIALVALAACGHDKGDRAISGAGIGAAAGGIGAAVIGADPVTGAAVGAAVGGVAGATTDEDDVDLGDPVWK